MKKTKLTNEALDRIKPITDKLDQLRAQPIWTADIPSDMAYYNDPLVVQAYLLPNGNVLIMTVHSKTGGFDIFGGCPFNKIEDCVKYVELLAEKPSIAKKMRAKEIRHAIAEELAATGVSVNGQMDHAIDKAILKTL